MPTLWGSEDPDILVGGAEDDLIYGFGGEDSIDSGAGNDTIEGGAGNDWLSGAAGRDMVSYALAPSSVTVRLHGLGHASGADGYDVLRYDAWPYTLDFEDARGSAFADTLYGSREANLLIGNGGDDLIFGFGGQDTIIGGDGADTITAHLDPATLTGGAGADLFGLVASTTPPYGLDALTTITTVTDFDGAAGDRLRILPDSNDLLPPDVGWPPGTICACIVSGGGSVFTVNYTGYLAGHPLVWAGAMQATTLDFGMALPLRDAALLVRLAAWVADPGGGGWLVVDLDRNGVLSAPDRVTRFDGDAAVTIGPEHFLTNTFRAGMVGTPGADALTGNDAPPPAAGGETIVLGFGAQTLAAPENDILIGAEGADTLSGLGGQDTLVGGAGADRMEGGAGQDQYLVDDRGDRVIETAEAGHDTVWSYVSFSLTPHVEALTLLEAADAIVGAGNGLANSITGNALANRLLGREGADSLVGLHGNDTLLGGDGNDALAGGTGDDRLDGGLGHDWLGGGDGHDTLLGGGERDALDGGAGDDLLGGGEGDDSLTGGDGTDTLLGGAGADTLMDGGGNDSTDRPDRLAGGAGDDVYLLFSALSSVIETDSGGADSVIGNAEGLFVMPKHVEAFVTPFVGSGMDVLGNAGDNWIEGGWSGFRLDGGGGNDTLTGQRGADTLDGGQGADLFRYLGADGQDVILGFTPGEDRIFMAASLNLAQWRIPYAVFDAEDLAAMLTETPDGALLTFHHQGFGLPPSTILFAGLAAAALAPSDFVFG
jgi:Ca2+-binding RTX toxin-like protein